MLSCIGDIDMMRSAPHVVAIPRGYTPPTELPNSYQCIVHALEIIDSHQPGFVYLRTSHKLTNSDNRRYVAERIENNETLFCDSNITKITAPMEYGREYLRRWVKHEFQNNRWLLESLVSAPVAHGPASKSTIDIRH